MAEHPISRTDPTLDPGGPDAFLAALSTRNQQLYLKTVGIIKEPAFRKSVEKTTKLFKAVESAGKVAGRMIGGMPMTRGLAGMPGQIAATGLDALGAQLIAPLTSAVSAGMGTLMAGLNTALGPALAKIGQGLSVVAKGGEGGTGIGGGLGSMIGGAIGSAYGPLGKAIGSLGGALLGGGIEMLFNRKKAPLADRTARLINKAKELSRIPGLSLREVYEMLLALELVTMQELGINSPEELAVFAGLPLEGGAVVDEGIGGGGAGDIPVRSGSGGVSGFGGGDITGGGADTIVSAVNNVNRNITQMRKEQRRAWL